jgi:hypothetical protein
MSIDPDSARSFLDRIEELQIRLRRLTPGDRTCGWTERFAEVLIGEFDEVRASIDRGEMLPKWILNDYIVMYFENPGIFTGELHDEVTDLTKELRNR